MSREEATKQLAALRDEAQQIAAIRENVGDALLKAFKELLMTANALEKAIEAWPDEPPPPPDDDLFTQIPGRLWSVDERSLVEGETFGVHDAYDKDRLLFVAPQIPPGTVIHDDGGWGISGHNGGWLTGPDAAPIRTLVVVAEWNEEPPGFAKLAGADGAGKRGGFALGAIPGGRTEAWADDGHAFAAIRAPLAVDRPVLHVLRIHEQSVELYVDGHEREIVYGQSIVPFTGSVILLAGWWRGEVVDQANAIAYNVHAYNRPISDDELAVLVEYFRDFAPPEKKPEPLPPQPPPDADITIDVAADPDQTFRAGGFSIQREDSGNPWIQGNPGEAFERMAFTDLSATIVRWWYDYDDAAFVRSYVTSGAMRAAVDHGVEHHLLGPIPFNAHGVSVPGSWGSSVATRSGLVRSADRVAILIHKLRHDHSLRITATGLMNEPGSAFRTSIREEDWTFHVDAMRDALDGRGLADVSIIGYEWQPPREQAEHYAAKLAGSQAGKMLAGIASHSYGITISDELARIARQQDWEYWMTEAGEARGGADAAARFLSDVNHRCTHWVFFLGPNTNVNHNTLLAPPNQLTPQYHSLRQMWQAFVPGTIVHLCTSSAEGQMRWFRGDKRLNVAAGVRPDGRWAVGLVNGTGGKDDEWRNYPPAETIMAAIRLPIEGRRVFRGLEGGEWTTDNGVLIVTTLPGEVLALIEDAG